MEAVALLQDLVRARSVNPPGDESKVAEILEAHLSKAGLQTEILVSGGDRASLIARVEGPDDDPPLVLLSHSDVVPVEEERWTRDPFGAELHEGFVWGRGTLDMKSIAVMHAVAAAELATSGRTPTREVIVVMAADEESGGTEGARWLVDERPDRVGFRDGHPPPEVLTEGAYGLEGVLERPVVPIAVGEKTAVWFDIVAEGDPGHGALPPERQAPVNLVNLVREIAGFGPPRVHPVMREQFATLAPIASGPNAAVLRALASPARGAVVRLVAARMRKEGALGLLLSDSLTPTQMSAGYKTNVVPGEARASFDCRLLPDTDIKGLLADVGKKARRYGAHVANVLQKGHGPVSGKGPLYKVMEGASRDLAAGAVPTISLSPAITDARFFRARGAQAYGWCPLVLTPELLATIHGHDERIEVDAFEKAVKVMTEVVAQAAS